MIVLRNNYYSDSGPYTGPYTGYALSSRPSSYLRTGYQRRTLSPANTQSPGSWEKLTNGQGAKVSNRAKPLFRRANTVSPRVSPARRPAVHF